RQGPDDASGETAAGRGPPADDRELRSGEIEGQARARICPGGRQHGDVREGAVCHRRYRCRAATTGARGDDGGDYRGNAHRREAGSSDCEDTNSERHVLRTANLLDWTNGK